MEWIDYLKRIRQWKIDWEKFHPVIEAMENWGQEYIEFMRKDD